MQVGYRDRAMPQTPPTAPLPDPDATRVVRPRRPRTTFYVTVGCLSVIAGLVLGVGGFVGVRTLQGEGAPLAGGEAGEPAGDVPGGASPGGADPEEVTSGSAGPGDPALETGGVTTPEGSATVLEETPVGPEAAVPFGSTIPLRSSHLEGEIEVTFTAMDWDATAEMLETNSLTEEPAEGSKYALLSLEGVYHGEGAVDWAPSWIRASYVAQDGTEHPRVYRVTPRFDELIEQAGASPGEAFLAELPFEIPEHLDGGGHVVLRDTGQALEEGAWVALV